MNHPTSSSWLAAFGALGAAGLLALACVDTAFVDGRTVPPVGSEAAPPTCDDVCGRLGRLCGQAPVACASRCEAEWPEAARVCVGQAPACQQALEGCFAEEEPEGDAGETPDDAEPEGDAGEGAGEGGPAREAGGDDAGATADGGPDAASDGARDGG